MMALTAWIPSPNIYSLAIVLRMPFWHGSASVLIRVLIMRSALLRLCMRRAGLRMGTPWAAIPEAMPLTVPAMLCHLTLPLQAHRHQTKYNFRDTGHCILLCRHSNSLIFNLN